MKLRGGYNVFLQGRPSAEVRPLPEPKALFLPLHSRRFRFTQLCVKEGERVSPGHVLAKDPANHSVPLLAPRAGTARLAVAKGHIVLRAITKAREEPYSAAEEMPHISRDMGSVGMKRYKLLMLGAWQFLHDAHTEALPDPFGTPRAVIVSTLRREPFVARGDVQLHKRLTNFTRGLEHLQSLLEYQPIYLILPDVKSAFAAQVRETLRGYAFVRLVEVPRRYPFDYFVVLARGLGLQYDPAQPVWAIGTAGVLAIDRALTLSRPSTVRIISVGGPGANSPQHVKAVPGYSLAAILRAHLNCRAARVINGGILRGQAVPQDQLGLDSECEGLTLIPEHIDREFLGFTRPGIGRRSYSRCFLSSLRGEFRERLTTALRGERRPCISCNFCEEVCPAGIMPHLIHKYLHQGALEEAASARVDLCVQCGLCSFVCPSKIELRKQFSEAQEAIWRELHAEGVR